MDNVCHTLIAGVLAKSGLERAAPRATAALVVGANLPDADIVATLFTGPGGYLVHHRAITHSWVGIALLGPLLALAFLLYSRWRDRPEGRARFAPLLWVSWTGLASHLLLDWTNPYGVRPWLPFDDRWIYADWIAIVDPWLWLVPGVVLFWVSGRGPRPTVAWGVLAAALTAAVALSGRAPAWIVAGWLAGLALAVVGAVRRFGRRGPVLAWGALGFVVLYSIGTAVAHRSALEAAEARFGRDPSSTLAAIPTPGDPLTWRVVEYGPDSVHVAVLTLGAGRAGDAGGAGRGERRVRSLGGFPLGLDTPAAAAALETEAGRSMMSFARFPFAETAPRPEGAVVYLRDARYALTEREGWGVMPIAVSGDRRAAANPD